MRLIVNAVESHVDEAATVTDVVHSLAGRDPRGVAVAVNGTVVPRTGWAATVLRTGDVVEVLTAVQGG
jgi:sulfur carrier protein